ncbi:MAG: radical SAM protein [Candidatus Margulisiibacteriota bacterium]
MKILVVSPRWFIGDIVNYRYMFPLGLAYIAAVLKKDGYDVDVLNLNHYPGPVDSIIKSVLSRKQYDHVLTGGISTFLNQIKAVVTAVRKINPDINIIVGGGVVSSEPELIYDYLKPTYGIIGEGEKTVSELIACLAKKEPVHNVQGLIYRDPHGICIKTSPRLPIANIDLIPYPDFDAFEFDKYLDHMHPSDQYSYDLFDQPRAYPIICSRSCPYLCTFCFHPLGNKYRQRSLGSIMAELRQNVPRYKINIVGIYDELFSNDRKRLLEFCDEMQAFTKTLPWDCRWGCQMRVDRVDDELLARMKASGCYTISYGFESYSLSVLKSMKKHIMPEQIKRAVDLTLKNEISIQGNFIFGDVAETRTTARTTLDFWKKHVEAGIILSFINPYPGTEIYQKLVERGVIKNKIDFISNHIFDIFNISEKMSNNEFGRLWFEVMKARILNRIYAGHYALRAGENGTVSIKVTCPHCHNEIEYHNYYVLSRKVLFLMFYCRACRRRFYVGSKIYRLVSFLLVVFAAVMPGFAYELFKRIWSFLKNHDPRFKDKGLLGRLSDNN